MLLLIYLQKKLIKNKYTKYIAFLLNIIEEGIFIIIVPIAIVFFNLLLIAYLFGFLYENNFYDFFFILLYIITIICGFILFNYIRKKDKLINCSKQYIILIILCYILMHIYLFSVYFYVIALFLKYILFISINIFLLGIISNIVFYSYKFSKKSITDDKH